jgi:indole-3-glycerol phosphate synthase
LSTSAPDLLEAILAATRRIVDGRRAREPFADVERRAQARRPNGQRFQEALARSGRLNIIAECKRRSPSRGVLRPRYDAAAIATAYAAAGAAAVSVLTEPTFFDGSPEHLRAVRAATTIPLLRKDFIVDEYQLVEAVADGADAVLLIVAALPDETLRRLQRQARAMGLATLVEVHDTGELDRALSVGATIVGVNNRNLRTLDVDLRVSDEIAARLPADVIAVSESGLGAAADLHRLQSIGYRAFLIGERFMTADDPGQALTALLRTGQGADA